MQKWKLIFFVHRRFDDLLPWKTTQLWCVCSVVAALVCVGSGQGEKPTCQHWAYRFPRRSNRGVLQECSAEQEGELIDLTWDCLLEIWLHKSLHAEFAHSCCSCPHTGMNLVAGSHAPQWYIFFMFLQMCKIIEFFYFMFLHFYQIWYFCINIPTLCLITFKVL